MFVLLICQWADSHKHIDFKLKPVLSIIIFSEYRYNMQHQICPLRENPGCYCDILKRFLI